MRLPGASSEWESRGGPDDIAAIGATADELGFDYLTCPEHVVVPDGESGHRGSTYWDPVATLSFLAARTRRIRLVTAVVVLGYHHPLEIAKRYGTLDRLSGGRLVLGVGVGSLAAEFDLLGAPFDDRGPRADDAIRAIRAAMSTDRPTYSGRYYSFDSVVLDPCAVQDRVPVWVGGRTRRSLRRAVEHGDGWIPFGLNASQLNQLLSTTPLPAGFEVALACGPLDPRGAPDATRERLAAVRRLGATAATCSVSAESADHYLEQLHALRALADDVEGAHP